MWETGFRDFDIHREILSELDWSQDVHSTEVGVQVSNGIATLTGVVASPCKKTAAAAAAHRVEGVRAVVDALLVHLPAFDGVTDVDVARDAIHGLSGFGRELVDHIRITVSQGCVVLGGQVRTHAERLEVEHHLREVEGISDVINGINVLGSDVDTRTIHNAIESSFQRMADQSARRISIETEGGRLVLKGTVDTWAERDAAERAALGVGATHIDNQIQVYPHTNVRAEELVYIAG